LESKDASESKVILVKMAHEVKMVHAVVKVAEAPEA